MAKTKQAKGRSKAKTKPNAKAGREQSTGSTFKKLADSPIVAELVDAALTSTAAALKDPTKAREMAGNAQQELTAVARDASKKGSAIWKLALEFGRQALDTLAGEAKGPKAAKAATKPAAKVARKAAKATAKPAAKTARKAVKATAKPAAKTVRKATKATAKPAAKTAR